MAIIKWRDSYNTGIEAVDLEHRKLVELIEVIYTNVRDKEPKDVVDIWIVWKSKSSHVIIFII